VHQDRRPVLLARGRIKAALRAWFEARDFTEVETAVLQVSPGNEAHLHAFATLATDPAGGSRPLYLHTSPEFSCKKLLAAGESRIHAFSHVWRNRERGPLHSPEFTMLEWYRTGAPYEQLMEDCGDLLATAAAAVGADRLTFRGRACDPFETPRRITVAQAFEDLAGIDLMATLPPDGPPDLSALTARARAAGIRVAEDDAWSDIFSRVLVEKIEPHLGDGRATLLSDYPAHEAALARPRPDDPRLSERFELYACGVELANAFGELTDAAEQRRRFEIEMAEKARLYGETYPIDEAFLAALAIMPEASGAALGFDRLVMLATGAARIDQVVWTPVI
jgi:lysyl-tRNA synthetase class 2